MQNFWLPATSKFNEEEVEAAKAIAALLPILACLCMFQAVYDQHSSTWVVQAQQMGKDVFGFEMPPAQVWTPSFSMHVPVALCISSIIVYLSSLEVHTRHVSLPKHIPRGWRPLLTR